MKQNIFFVLLVFLFGCNTSKKANVVNSNTSTVEEETLQKKNSNMLSEGIDFFAQGNQPVNWQLSINYDDTFRFSADDGLSLKFAYNQTTKTAAPEKRTYFFAGKAGKTMITILDKTCTVTTIRKVFTKEVTVDFNSILYAGCGSFLADKNLGGKWQLEKIGNTNINPADYNQVPFVEIDLEQNRFSGSDGCNRISSAIEVQGKRISFSPIAGTKMACAKKSIATVVGELMSGKIISYYFTNGKLHFYLPDDSMLVFVKS